VTLRDTLKGKLKHLRSAERAELIPVINEYSDLFRYDRSGMIPCTNKEFHEIKTGNAAPIKKNPYKVHFALKDEMKQFDDMLQRGVMINIAVLTCCLLLISGGKDTRMWRHVRDE